MRLAPRQLQRSGMTGAVPYYGGRFTPAQAYAASHAAPPLSPAPCPPAPPPPARSGTGSKPARAEAVAGPYFWRGSADSARPEARRAAAGAVERGGAPGSWVPLPRRGAVPATRSDFHG